MLFAYFRRFEETLVAILSSWIFCVYFRSLVDKIFKETEKFFTSPLEEKLPYKRKPGTNFGYIGTGEEKYILLCSYVSMFSGSAKLMQVFHVQQFNFHWKFVDKVQSPSDQNDLLVYRKPRKITIQIRKMTAEHDY